MGDQAPAACPLVYLESPLRKAFKLLSPDAWRQLRVDVRMLATMCVDIGEMRYKLQCADAVLQQEISRATICWFVAVCCGVRRQNIRLVGRMLLPKITPAKRPK